MIYVDELVQYNGKMWCHMFADTPQELHIFAKKMGLKREWFHNTNQRYPHYDLVISKRMQAIRRGAKEVNVYDFIRKRR